jgi:hypothetical protein
MNFDVHEVMNRGRVDRVPDQVSGFLVFNLNSPGLDWVAGLPEESIEARRLAITSSFDTSPTELGGDFDKSGVELAGLLDLRKKELEVKLAATRGAGV